MFKHTKTNLKIEKATPVGNEITLDMNFTAREIAVGDIFGITNANTTALTTLDGFYKATKVSGNKVTFESDKADWLEIDDTVTIKGTVTIFTSQRTKTVDDANTNITANLSSNELVWIDDDDNGKWTVLKNKPVYSEQSKKVLSTVNLDSTTHGFGHAISVNDANTKMAVGIPLKAMVKYTFMLDQTIALITF